MNLVQARDFYAILHGLRTNATEQESQRAITAARRLTGLARDRLDGPTPDQVATLLTDVMCALDEASDTIRADWPDRPVELALVRGGLL